MSSFSNYPDLSKCLNDIVINNFPQLDDDNNDNNTNNPYSKGPFISNPLII